MFKCWSLTQFFLLGALVAEARLDGFPSLETRNHHEHEVMESRIVGGSAADRGEYPYFVSWGGCAASLIAPDVILSAAHCSGISDSSVIVGAYQKWWGQTSGAAEKRTISERRRHPDYDGSTFENDFMVMKLTEAITTIQPVSLNGISTTPQVDETVTAIGFGAVFEGGWGPRLLQEVDVKYVSHEQCDIEYDGDIVEDVMLCAGVPGGGKDSCQGDSGGPLVIKSPDGDHVQVGVVSWGYGCARGGYSGVYSRISGAEEWINQQVCELSPKNCNTNSDINPPVSMTTTQTSSPADDDSRLDCTDSEIEKFHIDATYGMQSCSWLKEEINQYGYLCKFVDVATTCPSLCNICDLME